MACKYLYNNQLYTEQEIKNLITEGKISEIDNIPDSRVLNAFRNDEYSPLASILEEAAKWEKESEESQTMSHPRGVAARVTARVLGPINQMRGNPMTDDSMDLAEWEGKNRWGRFAPEAVLSTPLGLMNMEDFIERRRQEIESITKTGSLLHLYFKMFSSTSEKDLESAAEEIQRFKEANDIPEYSYNWLMSDTKDGKKLFQKIYSKIGVNTFEDIPEEQKDQLRAEVTVGDPDILGWVGTVDLMFQRADGTVGVRDFKSGWAFNKVESHELFKYGSRPGKPIFYSQRNKAKLQLMIYAMLMKVNNPNIKFDSIEVAWVPNRRQALMYDPQAAVEIEEYLGMIEAYLRNEEPGKYKRLIETYGKKIFDPKEYQPDYEKRVKEKLKDQEIKSVIETKLEELRAAVFYDLKDYNPNDKAGLQKKAQEKRASELFQEILELTDEYKISSQDIPDISFMSLWLANNNDIGSPFVQIYSQKLEEAKTKARYELQAKRTKFKALAEVVLKDSNRVYGKSPLESIGPLRSHFRWTKTEQDWGWLYKDVKDENGNIIGKKLISTPEDIQQAKAKFSLLGEWETRAELAKFLNETYSSFFLGANAVANRPATVREKTGEFGLTEVVKISNLELANEARADRHNSAFEYTSGWFPKVPKLMEEYGTILNPAYRKEMWDRSVKSILEDQYEQAFNYHEAVPMKYLGSDFIDSNQNFSMNAERQFEKFVANMTMKKYLDDVYAFGKGLMYYLEYSRADENNRYTNTIEYLKTALEMQVRGRKQMEFKPGFLGRQDWSARDTKGNVYAVDWLKVLRSARNVASAPIMWLKAGPGIANGIFAYLFTFKEAIKNDLIKAGPIAKMTGIEGDEFSFRAKDLVWAQKQFWTMQADAMKGELESNKLYLLAKRLGYLPDEYDWGGNSSDMLSLRLKAVSQSSMYMFHRVPEEFVSFMTLGAQLRSMKVNGKPIWDYYNVKTESTQSGQKFSTIEWDGTVRGKIKLADGSLRDLTELDSKEVLRMKYVYQRLHGGYRSDEKTKMEYYVLGEMFMQFKRYLPNILRSGFRSKGYDYNWGRYKKVGEDATTKEDIMEWHASVMEGRWKVFAGLMLNYLGMLKLKGRSSSNQNQFLKFIGIQPNESYKWSELSNEQKDTVVDLFVTMTMVQIMILGRWFMFGGGGVPDDDVLKNYYERIYKNFSQQWNVMEVMEDILSPNVVPASWRWTWNTTEASVEFFTSSILYGIGNEDEALTTKGELRGWRQLQRNVPFLSSAYEMRRIFDSLDAEGADYNPRGRR